MSLTSLETTSNLSVVAHSLFYHKMSSRIFAHWVNWNNLKDELMIKKKRQNNFVNCEQPYSNIQKYVALVCLKKIYILQHIFCSFIWFIWYMILYLSSQLSVRLNMKTSPSSGNFQWTSRYFLTFYRVNYIILSASSQNLCITEVVFLFNHGNVFMFSGDYLTTVSPLFFFHRDAYGLHYSHSGARLDGLPRVRVEW